MSLFIPGFNASDFVKFSSCSASGEIDQTQNLSQHPCQSAIDSIVCDNDNALICLGNCGVTFELQNPETFDKIIIQNGVGSQVNKIKAFRLKVKLENEKTLQGLTAITVKDDSKVEQMTDGYTALSQAQEYLEITFAPVKKASKIQIEVRDRSAKINEILIPRK